MNEYIRLSGVAIALSFLVSALRRADKGVGAAAAIAAGIILLYSALSIFSQAAEALRKLSVQAGLQEGTIRTLLKMLGMAYVTEFSVQCCKDAGEEGIAQKAALCGKLGLFLMTLPLLTQIAQMVLELIP